MKNWADEKGEQYNEIQEQDKWLVEFQAKNRKKLIYRVQNSWFGRI